MTIERILIQGDQSVDLVAVIERFVRRHAQAQPGMSAAYHGLIGVVRVNALSLPCHGQSERVAGRGDAIARGPTDTDDQVGMVHWYSSPAKNEQPGPRMTGETPVPPAVRSRRTERDPNRRGTLLGTVDVARVAARTETFG